MKSTCETRISELLKNDPEAVAMSFMVTLGPKKLTEMISYSESPENIASKTSMI